MYLVPFVAITGVFTTEYFPDLTYLFVPQAMLEECDLSGCPRLQHVDLYRNSLSSLDVSMLHELTWLRCGNNPELTELVLGDAPLNTLDLRDCYSLGTLDLSGQANLLKAYLEGESEHIRLFCH